MRKVVKTDPQIRGEQSTKMRSTRRIHARPSCDNQMTGETGKEVLGSSSSVPSAAKQPMSEMNELHTEKEAAARLRMSRRKLSELRKAGVITFLNTPCILYWEQHLLEYLASCEVKAGQRPTARIGYRAAGIHSDSNYQALAGIV